MSTATTPGRRSPRSRRRRRETDAPDADLLQDRHRFGRAEQAGHRSDARRGARRGRGRRDARKNSAGRMRRSRSPTRFAPAGIAATRGAEREAGVAKPSMPIAAAHPGARARVRAPHGAASCPLDWRDAARCARSRRDGQKPRGRDPQSSQRCSNALGADDARTDRRLGRPDRLEQHDAKARSTVVARRGRRNYIHYGVREFGMTAIMNGIALHGGFIPFGGTFLIFSEYARNAVRMAALMRLRNHPRLHARLDRSRRRRTDAPADRATVRACG